MNEVDLMRAVASTPAPQAAQAAPAPPQVSPLEAARRAREEFELSTPPKATVADTAPVQATAPASITYRDPESGKALTANVTMRVILDTDERMLVWQVAYAILRMAWDAAPAVARTEAYAQAVCRVQWENDPLAPAWFKRAYTNDVELAMRLAEEVDALTEAYFRGYDEAGRMATQERFVVRRESSTAPATPSV